MTKKLKSCDCGSPMTLSRETFRFQVPVIDTRTGKPVMEWSKDRKTGNRTMRQKTVEHVSTGLGHWRCPNGCRKERTA